MRRCAPVRRGLAARAVEGLDLRLYRGAVHGLSRRRDRRVVSGLGKVQADDPGTEAIPKDRHVASIQATGNEHGGHASRDDATQEHVLFGRLDGDLRQHEKRAEDGSQLVGAHVDDRLRGALSLQGQGREEKLVRRAEDGVAEDTVPPAGNEHGGEPWVDERQPRPQAGREGVQSDGPRHAEAVEGELGEEGLHHQGQERQSRIEGAEESDEPLAAGDVGRGFDLEDVVDHELGEGGEADEEGEVAEVGKLSQGQEAPPRVDQPFLVGRRVLVLPLGGAQEPQAGERRQVDEGQAEEHGGNRNAAGAEPGERAGGDASERSAGADPSHERLGRVRIEVLVDERPEAGDEGGAEEGEVDVDDYRGEAGTSRAQPPLAQVQGGR